MKPFHRAWFLRREVNGHHYHIGPYTWLGAQARRKPRMTVVYLKGTW